MQYFIDLLSFPKINSFNNWKDFILNPFNFEKFLQVIFCRNNFEVYNCISHKDEYITKWYAIIIRYCNIILTL